MTDDHDLPMEEYRRAGLEITRGNPEVYKSLWSRRDDVTLANPFGPPVRGWEDVSARLDLAASNYRDGRDYEFETISTVITPELAYTVEIERIRTRVGGSDELTAIAIRATTVFRREHGTWKVTHRHGDPITSMPPGGIGDPELGEALKRACEEVVAALPDTLRMQLREEFSIVENTVAANAREQVNTLSLRHRASGAESPTHLGRTDSVGSWVDPRVHRQRLEPRGGLVAASGRTA